MPVLGGKFPCYSRILSDKETVSVRLQSQVPDGQHKQLLTQGCLMLHPDLLTTGMLGSGITEPFPYKVPLS